MARERYGRGRSSKQEGKGKGGVVHARKRREERKYKVMDEERESKERWDVREMSEQVVGKRVVRSGHKVG